MKSSNRAAVVLPAIVFAVAGCASTLCIKTVDVATGLPLAGVTASWRQNHHGYFHLEHEGPTNLPPSDAEGIIRVDGLRKNWGSQFVFTCPGCSNVYGFYSSGKLALSDKVKYMPQGPLEGEFYLQGELKSSTKSNGCFIVPITR